MQKTNILPQIVSNLHLQVNYIGDKWDVWLGDKNKGHLSMNPCIYLSFFHETGNKKVTDNFLVLFQDELGWSIDTIDLSINQTTNARNISQDILHPDS